MVDVEALSMLAAPKYLACGDGKGSNASYIQYYERFISLDQDMHLQRKNGLY